MQRGEIIQQGPKTRQLGEFAEYWDCTSSLPLGPARTTEGDSVQLDGQVLTILSEELHMVVMHGPERMKMLGLHGGEKMLSPASL